MKKMLLLPAVLAVALVASDGGAASLQEQLDSIARVEAEGQARIKAQQEAKAARQKQAAKAAAELKKKETAARDAALRAKEDERLADKARDHKYEDEVRQLELTRMKLELESKSKRVTREDEFIDAQLEREAATTDTIQSEADSARAISAGTKAKMESEGKALEKEASSWFK